MVHGCFWHGCPKHSRPTKSHTKWWADKIKRNQERDEQTIQHWLDKGWQVLVFWEHDDPKHVAMQVEDVVINYRDASRLALGDRQSALDDGFNDALVIDEGG